MESHLVKPWPTNINSLISTSAVSLSVYYIWTMMKQNMKTQPLVEVNCVISALSFNIFLCRLQRKKLVFTTRTHRDLSSLKYSNWNLVIWLLPQYLMPLFHTFTVNLWCLLSHSVSVNQLWTVWAFHKARDVLQKCYSSVLQSDN